MQEQYFDPRFSSHPAVRSALLRNRAVRELDLRLRGEAVEIPVPTLEFAWSRIAGVKAGSGDGNSVTTGAIDTTGADLLIAVVGQESGVADITPTDSKGNTWNALTEQVEGAGRGCMFWSRPTSVGSGHTFTASQASSFPAIVVEAWSGSVSSPFDQQNGAHDSSAGATIQTGSVTPSEGNELIVAGATGRGQNATSIDSSFTLRNTQASSGTNDTAAIATLEQTSPASVNPTWTFSAAGGVKIALIATFKMLSVGNHRMFQVL